MHPITRWSTLVVVLVTAACARTTPAGPLVDTQPTNYLRCSWPAGAGPQQSAPVMIGPAGGEIRLKYNRLNIPRNALSDSIEFTLHEVPGDSVGLRIVSSRPGVTFAQPARVRVDVGKSRCDRDVDRGDYAIWHAATAGGPGRRLATSRPWFRNYMSAEITSNSYIMIAD